ncbi:unnamed protein product [Adineta ricciae]|uniref:Uncharacterized protein n=1 Tax=Adineta ricciae TaxID=249248 RepID=A0A814R5M9_ADIRI|nr:unnamed protein product [Adineta ricciae]CAF1603305.1 unnamed protein product [Adineta ricciae]
MWDDSYPCSRLFVCTAILCWDSQFSNISFFNITNCTPSPLYIQWNLRLTPKNRLYSPISKSNGFVCSDCSAQRDFFRYESSTLAQCQQRSTKIELKNYCLYSYGYQKRSCQCLPANYTIQPTRDWLKALVEPGKSHLNIDRVNRINKSAPISSYFLSGFIFLFILIGGVTGLVVYWIRAKVIGKKPPA